MEGRAVLARAPGHGTGALASWRGMVRIARAQISAALWVRIEVYWLLENESFLLGRDCRSGKRGTGQGGSVA